MQNAFRPITSAVLSVSGIELQKRWNEGRTFGNVAIHVDKCHGKLCVFRIHRSPTFISPEYIERIALHRFCHKIRFEQIQ